MHLSGSKTDEQAQNNSVIPEAEPQMMRASRIFQRLWHTKIPQEIVFRVTTVAGKAMSSMLF